MVNHEEFWHRDGAIRPLPVLDGVKFSEFDTRREHQRVSLRSNRQAPLLLACDGVTVSLHKMGWMKLQTIGTANIKDVSLSGIGLLTSEPLRIDEEIYIKYQGIILRCVVCRQQKIHGRLGFYGVSWLDKHDEKQRMAFIDLIRLKVNR